MAREVNIFISDITATGSNVSVAQYEITFTANWIDDAGVPHTRSEVVRFPNILAQVPQARLKEELKELLIWAVRLIWQVD